MGHIIAGSRVEKLNRTTNDGGISRVTSRGKGGRGIDGIEGWRGLKRFLKIFQAFLASSLFWDQMRRSLAHFGIFDRRYVGFGITFPKLFIQVTMRRKPKTLQRVDNQL